MQWKVGRLAALACLAVGGSMIAAPSSSWGADRALSLSPKAVQARSLALREDFGLSTNRARVRRLAHNRNAVLRGLSQYGIPLTAAETDRLRRREAIAGAARRLLAPLENDPVYAGTYVDQQADGTVVLQVTRDAAAIQRRLQGRFAHPKHLRVVLAQRSYDELNAVRGRVEALTADAERQGARITGVAVDVRRNRVAVYATGQLDGLRALLSPFGTATVVVGGSFRPTVCASRASCAPPLRGGLMIEARDDIDDDGVDEVLAGCTSGFVVEDRPDDQTQPTTASDYYLLTAGHCSEGLEAVPWWHDNTQLAPIDPTLNWDTSAQGADSGFDGGLIPIADELAANWLYTKSTAVPYPVRAERSLDTPRHYGEPVCISVPYQATAATPPKEGSMCGFVEFETADTPRDNGLYLRDQVIASISTSTGGSNGATQNGDSGGPVFSNSPNTAEGIVHGVATDPAGQPLNLFLYSKIGYLNAYAYNVGDFHVLRAPGPGGGTN